jgi:hypothetical protein
MDLISYWEEHPPVHLLIQGIASGLSGKHIGERRTSSDTAPSQPSNKNVESAEELAKILSGSGLDFSAYTLPKSAKPPGLN